MGCALSATADCAEHVVDPAKIDGVSGAATFEQEYSTGEIIGRGAFGKVYAASHRSTGRQCAVKYIQLLDDKLSQERKAEHAAVAHRKARAEVDVWQAVGKHPNIVELHGWVSDGVGFFLMVMERCSHTVSEELASGSLRKSDMPWLLREQLLGAHACHRVRVVHRDIKTDNFLVTKDALGHRVKLCDFGLAARLQSAGARGGAFLKGDAGTPPMMSPEMVQGKPYDTSTDVWSLGAMAYYILFKELPYVPKVISSTGAKEAIRIGEPKPRFLEGFPRPHVAFLRGLLEREPAKRVTAAEALRHPYFQDKQPNPHLGHIDSTSTLEPMDFHVDCFSSTDSPVDCESPRRARSTAARCANEPRAPAR